MTQLDPNIRERLQAMVAADPRGKAGVAERISKTAGKVSRAALSSILSDKYPGDPTRLRAKLLVFLGDGEIECPFLKRSIASGECQRLRTRPQPRNNARELRHWVACQDCALGMAICGGANRLEAGHAA